MKINNYKNVLILFCILSFIFICVVLYAYFNTFKWPLTHEQSIWASFGDFFGGVVNPIFGFVGLVALLLTIVLQTEELSATRSELSRSANAQESSQKALNEQILNQQRQQFEFSFFSLFRMWSELGEGAVGYPKGTSSLSDAQFAIHEVMEPFGYLESSDKDVLNFNLKESQYLLIEKHAKINQYFSVLYQVLKFIRKSCPKVMDAVGVVDEDKSLELERFYSGMVRSLISADLLRLLLVHCAVEDGDHFEDMKVLVERYEIFEHLRPLEDCCRLEMPEVFSYIYKSYSKSAFGAATFIDLNDYF